MSQGAPSHDRFNAISNAIKPEEFDVSGGWVTSDAMGCQTEIAESMIAEGAD